MSKKVKIFALVILGLAIVLGVVTHFNGKSPAPVQNGPLAVHTGGPIALPGGLDTSASASANSTFATNLASINSITIDTSIFSNPVYLSLRDHPVALGTDVVGRSNPFAPVGTDANDASATTPPQIQTLQPDKVTSTSAEFGGLATLSNTTPAQIIFQYGTSDAFGSATPPTKISKTGTTFATVTGLVPDTTYVVQAVVVQGSNTINGNTMSFSTTTARAPKR